VPRRNHSPITVAILGGNPTVGRALELILKDAGYDAQFLNGSFIYKPAELPQKVRLVLLTPGLHSKGRERFLESMANAPANAQIPILELVTGSERARADLHSCVPWPCPMKDLKRAIDAVLLNDSEVEVAAGP
jgi:hypothetical protein